MDCDEVIRRCPVEPCSVGRRGEPSRPWSDSPVREFGNVNLRISEAGFDDFEGQIRDTIEFLAEYDTQLRVMLSVLGIEGATIDFGLKWKDTYTHTDHLPAELIRLTGALNLAIDLSHYPISDPEDEELAMVP